MSGVSWRAVGVSAGLSAFFIVVYGFCNWVTGWRAGVGSFYFGWERALPFVPAMIVPYLSIDLFFVAAPFLARGERELSTLVRRVVAAITIAAVCFLIFPLQFAFERPQVAGVMGVVFDHFRQVDQRFNECPSLHIALLMILAEVYFRKTRGAVRLALGIWFGLIALSPVLVYQHHVIDIVGGFLLGAFCLHVFQEEPLRQAFEPNRRVGAYYGSGAVLMVFLAWVAWPWTAIGLWPAFSLALVAAGYLFLGPGIYRKCNGRLPWTTWLFLWPVLVGQRISLWHYARQCAPFDRLTSRLVIGRRLTCAEARRLDGIVAVLDLTCEFSECPALRGLEYLQLPILDLTAPASEQLARGVAFMCGHAERGTVYLHCKIGFSRTAAMAGAYLMAREEVKNPDEALALLRRARPGMIVRAEAEKSLRDAAQIRQGRENP